MAPARYDGHADWYDAAFGFLGTETGSGGLLGRLLGWADRDGQVCTTNQPLDPKGSRSALACVTCAPAETQRNPRAAA
jgi:hypothetical protein